MKEAWLMTIHLPEDLECYVQNQVQSGFFASEDEAITEAVRLLRQARSAVPSTRSQRLSEEELEQQMVQSGFLGHVPPRSGPTGVRRDFQPITIEGEPLSETVIRERH
jgi:putative addiction module CopG family antidote